MLAVAAARGLPRTRLLAADAFELASHVAAAGAVLSRGVLLSHYGPHWAPVLLGQVRKVLLPTGGFAVFDFLNAATRNDFPSNPGNKTYYSAAEMEALGAQAGFRRVSILGGPQRRVLLLLAE